MKLSDAPPKIVFLPEPDGPTGSPMLLPKPAGHVMTFWVICDHPSDFPNGYTMRPQFVVRLPGETVLAMYHGVIWYADDPEKLRQIVPPHCHFFPHRDEEDPVILETWME